MLALLRNGWVGICTSFGLLFCGELLFFFFFGKSTTTGRADIDFRGWIWIWICLSGETQAKGEIGKSWVGSLLGLM
jgi:hypothetical protein